MAIGAVANSGLIAQQQRVAVASNNLANANTTAFSPSRVEQADQIASPRTGGEAGAPEAGTEIQAVTRSSEQGPLRSTGRSLDVAVQGEGFIPVEIGEGQAFTRSGSLQVNGEGQLTGPNGNPLSADIQVPQEAEGVQIGPDGTVSARVGGETQELGQIELAGFQNPAGLASQGGGLFTATAASGEAQAGASGTLVQGTLEASAARPVDDMVDLISGQRAFEANLAAVRTDAEMQDSLLDMRT